MEKCYIVSTGEYNRNVHSVHKTLEHATETYNKLKKGFMEYWGDLSHYESIEELQEQCNNEFHLTTHFLEG
jgi:hypothetical protein